MKKTWCPPISPLLVFTDLCILSFLMMETRYSKAYMQNEASEAGASHTSLHSRSFIPTRSSHDVYHGGSIIIEESVSPTAIYESDFEVLVYLEADIVPDNEKLVQDTEGTSVVSCAPIPIPTLAQRLQNWEEFYGARQSDCAYGPAWAKIQVGGEWSFVVLLLTNRETTPTSSGARELSRASTEPSVKL